ncbi:RsmB/NOP family class I SAM-dependent RNA methyltransferase [Cohnella fermenti]|uniref:RNA methyltransferase n=1 Tax=Cohnella fermenti TaxID=2565925 RepID=A0A4S4C7G5_9BACL|nr:RsmB/NOP family class I SAM-dependent RNA methyltransferase [Cohnella fermenti]THF83888.1 RNA methyltransferase [Cohnella fermenti]
MTSLPAPYVERIKQQLGEEAAAFLDSYSSPRTYGLRMNLLKAAESPEACAVVRAQFGLKPVPWCAEGCFYEESVRPGKNPFHQAGLYYIQEPSAMIAAELLDPQPGEIVLDLAAAPGGKTTQIAGKLAGRGLLVANEIHPGRARILAENVERLGIRNAVVVNAAPDELSARWPEAFDRIMLDAPCSGEGMFRKDEGAAAEWSPEAVDVCVRRQRSILPDAARMLKPGGRLVYSTCTFNRAENEETIAWFLGEFPDFRLLREERMWPHRGEGEGHYAAVLEKLAGEDAEQADAEPRSRVQRSQPEPRRAKPSPRAAQARRGDPAASRLTAALEQFQQFAREALPGFELPPEGEPLLFGDALYWLPVPAGSPLSTHSLGGLRTPRPGLHLGDVLRGRFEPSHALAMAASAGDASRSVNLAPDSPQAAAYLRGESLPSPEPPMRGWGLITIAGLPLGWFKASDGQLKNRLPKGLRQV